MTTNEMTLTAALRSPVRDWFAGRAMAWAGGISAANIVANEKAIAAAGLTEDLVEAAMCETASRLAYDYADQMLKARKEIKTDE